MKKIINTIVLSMLLLSPMLSQSQIRFGIRGTIHTSNISEIHAESVQRVAGSLGALAQFPIGYDNQYFIQTEVSYSLQGEKDQGNKSGYYARNADYFQNYITVPVYFRAYFSEADSEFFGELGPQVSFLISQKEKEKELREYGDNPKSLDISIGAGIGYSFLRRYEIFIRYNYGLVDIYKNYSGQQRTSILAAGIAYVFD